MYLLIHFLHPEFLYALTLLAIPVILHLFNLKKYKKVYFSNFNFLEALQQQRKNSSRLKNLLLLLLRLLIISCIVIAFAAPYINPEHKSVPQPEKRQVIIYADNSFSMTNSGSQSSLFEESKKYLLDIINTYPAGTVFRLLTNDTRNDMIYTKEQMYQVLGQLKISSAAKSLSQIFKESREISGQQPYTLFLISDFQKKICDFQHTVPDSVQEVVFLVLKPENQNNVYIDNIHFEQAFHQKNQHDKLLISITNASAEEVHHLPVSLTINGKKKSMTQVDLPPQSEKKIEINYLNTDHGIYKGIVEISDFPVIFDNKFYFSYNINSKTEILYIWQNQANPYFGKLFSDTTTFGFTSLALNQLSPKTFSHYNLIILDDIDHSHSGLESMLEEYLVQGGNLFFLPGQSSVSPQNHFLQKLQAPHWGSRDTSTLVYHIETQSSLFRNVFEQEDKHAVLPQITYFYPLIPVSGTENLLTDKRGNILLAGKTFGKGTLYLSAFSFTPANSNMVFHPLFVPLMANMACRLNAASNTSYFLNTTQAIPLTPQKYRENSPLHIRKEDRSFEFIPEIRKDFSGDLLLTNNYNIREAGLYEIVQEEQVIGVLAWNYDRTESQMEFCPEETLQQQFLHARVENIKTTRTDYNSQLVKEIILADTNKYLTSWFLMLAIIALLLEQIIWRRKLN